MTTARPSSPASSIQRAAVPAVRTVSTTAARSPTDSPSGWTRTRSRGRSRSAAARTPTSLEASALPRCRRATPARPPTSTSISVGGRSSDWTSPCSATRMAGSPATPAAADRTHRRPRSTPPRPHPAAKCLKYCHDLVHPAEIRARPAGDHGGREQHHVCDLECARGGGTGARRLRPARDRLYRPPGREPGLWALADHRADPGCDRPLGTRPRLDRQRAHPLRDPDCGGGRVLFSSREPPGCCARDGGASQLHLQAPHSTGPDLRYRELGDRAGNRLRDGGQALLIDLERLLLELARVVQAPAARLVQRPLLHRGNHVAVEGPGMVGVEARRDRRMVRVAVGKPDDLQPSRIGIFLDAQLLQWVDRVAIPGPVGDGVAHAPELGDLVIGGIDPADQGPARLTRIASFQVLPELVHYRPRDSERQYFRR